MAAIGDTAPVLKLVAERAIAAVAVTPPKKGVIRLPKPCASNSLLALWRLPDMPSSTTAHSNDSMAPSMAMAKAAGSSSGIKFRDSPSGCSLAPGLFQGQSNVGK